MVTLQHFAMSCGGSKGRCPCGGRGRDLLVPVARSIWPAREEGQKATAAHWEVVENLKKTKQKYTWDFKYIVYIYYIYI